MKRPAIALLGLAARLVPRRVALAVYRFPRLAQAIRSVVNLAASGGLEEVEIVHGGIAGLRLHLDLKAEKYLWLGTYEPWVQEAILRHLRSQMHAWDIGAFIGYHTLLMWRTVRPGQVLALEPDPTNRSRLERNLALNGATDVAVVAAAAGGRRGQARLDRIPDRPGETRVIGSGRDCDVIPLDALLDDFPAPSLVKLDVEGAEDDVLLGAQRLLAEIRPVWVIEVHRPSGRRAVETLREGGYETVRIGKGVEVRADLPIGGPSHIVAVPR